MPKAIALYSGGLDSLLSILIIQRQGIEVSAIRFLTPFNTKIREKSSLSKKSPTNNSLNLIVQDYPIFEKFLEILKKPKFGYGKNMNPCVDCKILMLKEAKKIMIEGGYDFIITGEVLWQRPMSQRRDILSVIDKEASVRGHIVRPLSAKLFNPSYAEQNGIIDRQRLYNLSGRSRKPQMKLAEEFDIKEYPQPASGCLLTDPLYSLKLRELLINNPHPSINDINLLQLGRHFRCKETKIIVGRDKIDNELIESLVEPGDVLLWVEDYGSPLTIIRGVISDEIIGYAASICARYSAAKKLSLVDVSVKIFSGNSSKDSIIKVKPASDDMLHSLQIDKERELLFIR